MPVIERLYAKWVAAKKQCLSLFLPNAEAENAIEFLYTRRAPCNIGVQQYLRIRIRLECEAFRLEMCAEFFRIVQFSVVYDGICVAVEHPLHGLRASRRVHNRQPPVAQQRVPRHMVAERVRPPVAECLRHTFYDRRIQKKFPPVVNNANNTAHSIFSRFPKLSLFDHEWISNRLLSILCGGEQDWLKHPIIQKAAKDKAALNKLYK